jgi:hypothetical protein
VLVLAHGDGRRWVNADGGQFLGHPKHFVTVNGETLIGRAVRLFAGHPNVDEVVVVGPDERYDLPGARRVALDEINSCGSDMGKFLDTRHLWAEDRRTVIVWGDVWYSQAAVDTICDHPGDAYHVFRRPGRSKVTGHRWDESFAVSFGPGEHVRVVEVAAQLADLVRRGRLPSTHIRTHMAAMAGVRTAWLDDLKVAAGCRNQTVIDDWTDDFDSPAEWASWIGRRMEGRYRVAVCVPWTGGDDWRTRSYLWTVDYWRRHGLEVHVGDDTTGGAWPNRSAARNAAAVAAGDGWDCLFFADADTFVPVEQLWAAAHLAVEQQRLVLAFDRYVKIPRVFTDRVLSGRVEFGPKRARQGATVWTHHASGAVMVPRTVWDTVGGFDERFASWGGEDRAFWLAANTLCGEADRIPGPAFHWWHPRAIDKQRDLPEYAANIELGLRYKAAAGVEHATGALPRLRSVAPPDPDMVRSILSEPGGPLAGRRAKGGGGRGGSAARLGRDQGVAELGGDRPADAGVGRTGRRPGARPVAV